MRATDAPAAAAAAFSPWCAGPQSSRRFGARCALHRANVLRCFRVRFGCLLRSCCGDSRSSLRGSAARLGTAKVVCRRCFRGTDCSGGLCAIVLDGLTAFARISGQGTCLRSGVGRTRSRNALAHALRRVRKPRFGALRTLQARPGLHRPVARLPALRRSMGLARMHRMQRA